MCGRAGVMGEQLNLSEKRGLRVTRGDALRTDDPSLSP